MTKQFKNNNRMSEPTSRGIFTPNHKGRDEREGATRKPEFGRPRTLGSKMRSFIFKTAFWIGFPSAAVAFGFQQNPGSFTATKEYISSKLEEVSEWIEEDNKNPITETYNMRKNPRYIKYNQEKKDYQPIEHSSKNY